MKLNVCMLLPLRYEPNLRVVPQIGIASYLTHFGHQVTWVLSSENARGTQQLLLNNVHIYVIPTVQYFPGSSILAKILNKIPNNFNRMRFTLKIFKEGKYNIIFVRNGIFDGLIAAYIKRSYKVPFVFEFANPLEEDWRDHRLEYRKPIFWSYLIVKFNTLMSTYIMKKADLVLPTTRWFEEELVNKGASKSKIMPYPNGVDIDFFWNKDGKDVRKKYHLDNSKVIIYIGTMAIARYLGVLIKAFAKVKRDRGDVKLLMVGEGTDRENLQRLAKELGMKDDVIFAGEVPQSEVPHFIAAADIGISPVPPSSFYKVSSPIKIFEYMAMAKPVVANEEILEHKEVIEQSQSGILVPFEEGAFANAIIELLSNAEMAAEMGRKGQEWVVRNRSYEVLARRLEEKYFELLSKQKKKLDKVVV